MEPINKNDIPSSSKLYMVVKTEPNFCHLVVGGDKLSYENEMTAPAANLLESKLMFNSTANQHT